MEGQMWPKEREFLYTAVIEKRPLFAFEVGTWKGGGSTYQIAKALNENFLTHKTKGRLVTCETNKEFFNEARKIYEDTSLGTYISCVNSSSTDTIKTLIANDEIPDFVFFDGPDDAKLTISDFKLLDPYLKTGSLFCMHDWDQGPRSDGVSANKPALIRPYLEEHDEWKILRSLTAPVSVGIVLAEKLAD